MTASEAQIATNYADVRRRIEAACARAGRSVTDVTLIAVTKYADIDWVRTLLSLGVSQLGESRPQQLFERAELFPNNVCWHLVGHLQRNKARRTLQLAEWIHSVDTTRLLERIDSLSLELDVSPRVLLEVNVSGETAKQGFTVDKLIAEWDAIRALRNVRVEGLMTMAPRANDAERTRPIFRKLRELRDQLRDSGNSAHMLTQLSMGMSRDLEVAVEEGATLIRVGSALFRNLQRASSG